MKIADVQKLILQPLLVLVLILHQIIIQLLLDVRKDVEQLIEVVLANHADCRIVLGLNRSCALRASQ